MAIGTRLERIKDNMPVQPPLVRICAVCRFYGSAKRGQCGVSGRKMNRRMFACQYFKALGDEEG